jgi:hypothetical protein
MSVRPRTAHALAMKARRCGKCGKKVNNQRMRCKGCSNPLTKPKYKK